MLVSLTTEVRIHTRIHQLSSHSVHTHTTIATMATLTILKNSICQFFGFFTIVQEGMSSLLSLFVVVAVVVCAVVVVVVVVVV